MPKKINMEAHKSPIILLLLFFAFMVNIELKKMEGAKHPIRDALNEEAIADGEKKIVSQGYKIIYPNKPNPPEFSEGGELLFSYASLTLNLYQFNENENQADMRRAIADIKPHLDTIKPAEHYIHFFSDSVWARYNSTYTKLWLLGDTLEFDKFLSGKDKMIISLAQRHPHVIDAYDSCFNSFLNKEDSIIHKLNSKK